MKINYIILVNMHNRAGRSRRRQPAFRTPPSESQDGSGELDALAGQLPQRENQIPRNGKKYNDSLQNFLMYAAKK